MIQDYFVLSGSSRGIGFSILKELIDRKIPVIALSRNIKPIEDYLSQKEGIDSSLVTALSFDICSEESHNKLKAVLEGKKIQALVNNAGYLINKAFLDSDIHDWQKQFDVNVFGALKLVQTVQPYMIKKSHIVNISSMGGFQGSSKFPGLSTYSASKGALSIASECLAVELAEYDIRVNALCLGAVQTEMLATAFPGYTPPVQADQMGAYITEFTLTGAQLFNGQVIPVTLTDPN